MYVLSGITVITGKMNASQSKAKVNKKVAQLYKMSYGKEII